MQIEERVVVADYNTTIEAEMAKSILACAGIGASIENSHLILPGIRARLIVAASDYRLAKVLLRLRE